MTADGGLRLYDGERLLEHRSAEAWVSVHPTGRKLAATWPPDDLEWLLNELWSVLGRYGIDDQPLGPPENYAAASLNEREALLTHVLSTAGVRVDSTDDKAMFADLRDTIARHFRATA